MASHLGEHEREDLASAMRLILAGLSPASLRSRIVEGRSLWQDATRFQQGTLRQVAADPQVQAILRELTLGKVADAILLARPDLHPIVTADPAWLERQVVEMSQVLLNQP